MANEVAEVKTETETKDEKTPETPVTEPITNGTNTPESPKVEIPATEEAAPVASPESDKTDPEPKSEPEPEQLPVNGLSLEETKTEETVETQNEESKPDESPAESSETAPVIEIPVKKEVCVDQMPLIEPTPPPLPANPPPSSVASFAATTMAPDLTDASLANTAESAISTPPAVLDTKTDTPNENITEIQTDLPNSETSVEISTCLSKTNDNNEIIKHADSSCNGSAEPLVKVEETVANIDKISEITQDETATHEEARDDKIAESTEVVPEPIEVRSESSAENPQPLDQQLPVIPEPLETVLQPESIPSEPTELLPEPIETVPEPAASLPESEILSSEVSDDLPPPPPTEDDDIDAKTEITIESIQQEEHNGTNEILNCNYKKSELTETNGIVEEPLNGNVETEEQNVKNKCKDSLGNLIETIECNGNIEEDEIVTKEDMSPPAQTTETTEESLPPSPSEAEAGAASASDSFPAPPSEPASPPAEPQVNTARAAMLM